MSLHQSISHLTKQEQNDLRHIVKTISAALQPVLVFCFGIRLSQQLQRSCFSQKRRKENSNVIYDLLIILRDKDALTDEMAATVAKRMIGSSINANILVHRLQFMKTQLLEMNFFFTWVHRSAIQLINRDNALAQLQLQKKKTDILPVSQQYMAAIKEELEKTRALLIQASDNWLVQPFAITLTALRQCAKEIIMALIKLGLGYDASHLSIEDSIKLSGNFCTILADVFPGNTPEEKKIYALLTGSDTPEKIGHNELLLLLSRIKDLKQKVNDYQFSNSTLLKSHHEEQAKKINSLQ